MSTGLETALASRLLNLRLQAPSGFRSLRHDTSRLNPAGRHAPVHSPEMIPLRDNEIRHSVPIVTWVLILLNCIVYLWDRQWHLFGTQTAFADLAMRPNEVMEAFQGPDRFPLVTIFTSLFLHANLMHLLGNMIFLLVFGAGVEEALGSARYALYYLFWGIVATGTHIFINPSSIVPILGASGAIGGVLGAYFLLFPANKVEIVIPVFLFASTVVSAWILLGVWFAWQVLVPQQGVANWAHAGGFLAGMLTVLIMGGRSAVLKHRARQVDYDF